MGTYAGPLLARIDPECSPAPSPGVLPQTQLTEVAPFTTDKFPDAYLIEAAKDCEGNHLSFPIPPIELLEHMLQHPDHRPIRQLLEPSLVCLAAVHDELLALTNQLLHTPALGRFPALQARLAPAPPPSDVSCHQKQRFSLFMLLGVRPGIVLFCSRLRVVSNLPCPLVGTYPRGGWGHATECAHSYSSQSRRVD
eukprot:scaffold27105_cov32-Tisochrysis_lutea.AAC.3